MANAAYPKAMEALALGLWNWSAADVRAVLIDENLYAYNVAHQYLADIPVGARIAMSDPLTGKTATSGVLDAVDIVIPAVTGSNDITALVLVAYTGNATTSRLLTYVDTDPDGVPLALTPDGSNVVITWNDGADKIARI